MLLTIHADVLHGHACSGERHNVLSFVYRIKQRCWHPHALQTGHGPAMDRMGEARLLLDARGRHGHRDGVMDQVERLMLVASGDELASSMQSSAALQVRALHRSNFPAVCQCCMGMPETALQRRVISADCACRAPVSCIFSRPPTIMPNCITRSSPHNPEASQSMLRVLRHSGLV